MQFGYKQGFDVTKDGPALVGYLSALAGLDLLNKWRHAKQVKQLKTQMIPVENDDE